MLKRCDLIKYYLLFYQRHLEEKQAFLLLLVHGGKNRVTSGTFWCHHVDLY
jgi:hypothetical protein